MDGRDTPPITANEKVVKPSCVDIPRLKEKSKFYYLEGNDLMKSETLVTTSLILF